MQQERSFLRRVKCLRPFIYENYPSSRRAYFSIRLAVKTSRPHFLFSIAIGNIKNNIIMQRYYKFKGIPNFKGNLNSDF